MPPDEQKCHVPESSLLNITLEDFSEGELLLILEKKKKSFHISYRNLGIN